MFLGFALAAAIEPSPRPVPSPTLSPIAIYDRAISTMRALPKPPTATYHSVLTVSGIAMSCGKKDLDFTGFSRGSYTYTYDTQFKAPNTSKTVGEIDGKPCTSDGILPPFFNFDDKPKPSASPSPSSDANGLAIITTVRSVNHSYDVTLLGIENDEGHSVYHLGLRARRDPDDNPLSSMLVDTQSFRVRHLTAEVHESEWGVAARVHVSVAFNESGLYFVVDKMNVDVGLAALIFFRKRINVNIENSHYAFDTTTR